MIRRGGRSYIKASFPDGEVREKYILLALSILLITPIVQGILPVYSRVLADSTATILFIFFLLISYRCFWRSSFILYLIGSGVGFIFEYLGVNYGVLFGKYTYIGFKHILFLNVPAPIIFAWGMYITYSYTAAISISEKYRWIYASILITIIDLAIDPVMVANHIWIWHSNTLISWFNIPITNFIGWFIISSISIILYEKLCKSPPLKHLLKHKSFLGVIPLYSLYIPLVYEADNVFPSIVYSLVLLTISLLAIYWIETSR